jgi:hypothetical protein
MFWVYARPWTTKWCVGMWSDGQLAWDFSSRTPYRWPEPTEASGNWCFASAVSDVSRDESIAAARRVLSSSATT